MTEPWRERVSDLVARLEKGDPVDPLAILYGVNDDRILAALSEALDVAAAPPAPYSEDLKMVRDWMDAAGELEPPMGAPPDVTEDGSAFDPDEHGPHDLDDWPSDIDGGE